MKHGRLCGGSIDRSSRMRSRSRKKSEERQSRLVKHLTTVYVDNVGRQRYVWTYYVMLIIILVCIAVKIPW